MDCDSPDDDKSLKGGGVGAAVDDEEMEEGDCSTIDDVEPRKNGDGAGEVVLWLGIHFDLSSLSSSGSREGSGLPVPAKL